MPANFCVGPKSYGIGFPLEGWSLVVPVGVPQSRSSENFRV